VVVSGRVIENTKYIGGSQCLFPRFPEEGLCKPNLSQAGITMLGVSVPFRLERDSPFGPLYNVSATFTASFDSTSDAARRAALSACHTVNIDVQGSGEEN
jgi:hypothetical protein